MSRVVCDRFIGIVEAIGRDLLGKEDTIALVLCAFFARGHVLLEDIPGSGKTTLAKSLSSTLGLEFGRIQFTSDMLPSDILGVSYYDQKSSKFILKKGAIFTQFLLCDEINRSMPKTQSALLEAMAEHSVSIDGVTYNLDEPFFVIGTQNPQEEVGVFTLPMSQLDRFICSFGIGYPSREAEREVLLSTTKQSLSEPILGLEQIEQILAEVLEVHLSDAMINYMQDIIAYTRDSGKFVYGLSTRGALALRDMCKSWATLQGRNFATPDDLQSVAMSVFAHRLRAKDRSLSAKQICDDIFKNTTAEI